jgi:hypothetical protein
LDSPTQTPLQHVRYDAPQPVAVQSAPPTPPVAAAPTPPVPDPPTPPVPDPPAALLPPALTTPVPAVPPVARAPPVASAPPGPASPPAELLGELPPLPFAPAPTVPVLDVPPGELPPLPEAALPPSEAPPFAEPPPDPGAAPASRRDADVSPAHAATTNAAPKKAARARRVTADGAVRRDLHTRTSRPVYSLHAVGEPVVARNASVRLAASVMPVVAKISFRAEILRTRSTTRAITRTTHAPPDFLG